LNKKYKKRNPIGTEVSSIKGSKMEPIDENLIGEEIDCSKSKSKSLHDVSKGMLQPKIFQNYYKNKTFNFEIYNENAKDKFDCP